MNTRLLLLLVGFILTAALAFTAGWITKKPVILTKSVNERGEPIVIRYEVPNLDDLPTPSQPMPADDADGPGFTVRDAAPNRARAAGENNPRFSEMRANYKNINAALYESDPITRMQMFAEMLGQITAENAQMMVEALDDLPQGYDRNRERGLLLYAWAQVDGAAAIEHVSSGTDQGWGKQMNAYSVLTGWATKDPEAAETWAREEHEGKDNPYLIGVIHGLSRTDLTAATDLTYSLPYGRNRGKAVDALVNGHFQKSPETAMDWVEALPENDAQLKNGIFQRVASKMANVDPYRAAEWVMDAAEGETRQQAVAEVADEWAEKNPSQAAEWVDRLDDGPEKVGAMSQVVGEWARRDPEQAANWLNNQPKGESLDQPIQSFVRRVMRDDPETAMLWAGQISNTENRRKTLERLAGDWMRRDPEAAQQFLN